ncbi:MAG: nucleotide sugar dehydrogenase [Gemmatimonadetes bacterium]|nr:nucleotide sugar dehydrogenase [Gemmatimonadota bacterium]
MSVERDLIAKAEARAAVFGVIGLGYVGLPLAVELAAAGYRVIGYDVNRRVVDGVNAGRSHILDVSSERLAPLVQAGRLAVTDEAKRLVEADAVSICVPTPLSKTKDPDISYVMAAAQALHGVVRAGQVVILESTTYPGTTRELFLPVFENAELKVYDKGVDRPPDYASYGESLSIREGDIFLPRTSPEAAELTKLLENTFRSVNIGLVNEMAIVCDKLGVDVWEVIEAAATKPFGFMKFTPGPGLGGHCIPIDPHYLAWKMRGLNYKTRFIEVAAEVNSEMPAFWVRKVVERLNQDSKPVRGSRILVMGVAYKKDSDDLRESPALDVIRLLLAQGADVSYHDPHVPEFSEDARTLRSVPLSPEAVRSADCVVVVTDHSGVDYRMLCREARAIVDTRHVLSEYTRA